MPSTFHKYILLQKQNLKILQKVAVALKLCMYKEKNISKRRRYMQYSKLFFVIICKKYIPKLTMKVSTYDKSYRSLLNFKSNLF